MTHDVVQTQTSFSVKFGEKISKIARSKTKSHLTHKIVYEVYLELVETFF